MARDAIVSITATEARSAGERAVARGDAERDVVLAVMSAARGGFMAPTDDEAFLAGVAALTEVLPERRELIMAEARSIGDRSKVLAALMNGVPVDFDQVEFEPMPDGALGLVDLFREASA